MRQPGIERLDGMHKTSGYKKTFEAFWKLKVLYIFVLPAVIFTIVFNYRPMYGIIMAFQKYDILKGIWGSQFIGIDNFKEFLTNPDFLNSLRNTAVISLLTIAICFPIPILFAILINEYGWVRFKKFTQSVTYLPYFISWVIVTGLVYKMLDQDSGIVNYILVKMGFDTIGFLREPAYFWGIYIVSKIWKETGWNSILYISAMTAINPELYEAAIADGAGRFRKIWHITLPGILPTVVMLFILTISSFFTAAGGFESILALRNSMVGQTADTLDVLNYYKGILMGQYGYSTAIGLTQSLLSLVLLYLSNKGLKKLTGYSLF